MRPRVEIVSLLIRVMIVAVAPAGLTERQRGGVGGAAGGEKVIITVPAAFVVGHDECLLTPLCITNTTV